MVGDETAFSPFSKGTNMTDRFVITDPKQLEQVISWHTDGRGIYRWTNKEIGVCRGDIITPGDVTQAPHWAYVGHPTEESIDNIDYVVRTPVDYIAEDFPVCEHCHGTGYRSVADLAKIRQEDPEATREHLRKPDSPWKLVDDDHFVCNFCNKTGHIVTRISGRGVRKYWGGVWFSRTLQNKAYTMSIKLKKHYRIEGPVRWDYEWSWSNTYTVRFFAEKTTPVRELIPAQV